VNFVSKLNLKTERTTRSLGPCARCKYSDAYLRCQFGWIRELGLGSPRNIPHDCPRYRGRAPNPGNPGPKVRGGLRFKVGSKLPRLEWKRCPLCGSTIPEENHLTSLVEICPRCGEVLEGERKGVFKCPKCKRRFSKGKTILLGMKVICPSQRFG